MHTWNPSTVRHRQGDGMFAVSLGYVVRTSSNSKLGCDSVECLPGTCKALGSIHNLADNAKQWHRKAHTHFLYHFKLFKTWVELSTRKSFQWQQKKSWDITGFQVPRLRFSSHHPLGGSQLFITPVPMNPSHALRWISTLQRTQIHEAKIVIK